MYCTNSRCDTPRMMLVFGRSTDTTVVDVMLRFIHACTTRSLTRTWPRIGPMRPGRHNDMYLSSPLPQLVRMPC